MEMHKWEYDEGLILICVGGQVETWRHLDHKAMGTFLECTQLLILNVMNWLHFLLLLITN